MFSAARLQYWQRWPSRANTARRESGTRLRYGTRTKWLRRITDGTGSWARSERRTAPLRATISAFSLSTRTTARRMGTTQSGSKLALSSRALPKRRHLPPVGARRASRSGHGSTASLPGAPFWSGRFRSLRVLMAPLEVVDQVVGIGPTIGAVLRLEPEPQVVGIRDRCERRSRPPPRTRQPQRLPQRGPPQPRTREHQQRGAPPERRAGQPFGRRRRRLVRHACARYPTAPGDRPR